LSISTPKCGLHGGAAWKTVSPDNRTKSFPTRFSLLWSNP
jgi:hypothetical protein